METLDTDLTESNLLYDNYYNMRPEYRREPEQDTFKDEGKRTFHDTAILLTSRPAFVRRYFKMQAPAPHELEDVCDAFCAPTAHHPLMAPEHLEHQKWVTSSSSELLCEMILDDQESDRKSEAMNELLSVLCGLVEALIALDQKTSIARGYYPNAPGLHDKCARLLLSVSGFCCKNDLKPLLRATIQAQSLKLFAAPSSAHSEVIAAQLNHDHALGIHPSWDTWFTPPRAKIDAGNSKAVEEWVTSFKELKKGLVDAADSSLKAWLDGCLTETRIASFQKRRSAGNYLQSDTRRSRSR